MTPLTAFREGHDEYDGERWQRAWPQFGSKEVVS
jgi:hypothetical protein